MYMSKRHIPSIKRYMPLVFMSLYVLAYATIFIIRRIPYYLNPCLHHKSSKGMWDGIYIQILLTYSYR